MVHVLSSYGFIHGAVRSKFMSLCPFHHESTPSCEFDLKNSTFRCYGCGVYGDHIDFIVEAEGVNHIKAFAIYDRMKQGEKRVVIADPVDSEQMSSDATWDAWREYNAVPPHKWEAEDYMVKRGFLPKVLDQFGVRVMAGSYGVIMPLYVGKTFAGYIKRRVDGVDRRKYLFNRGLQRSSTLPHTSIAPTMYITEGLIDYMKLHQFGATNSAALLGWHASDQQVAQLMAGGCTRVISTLDNTESGDRGVARLRQVGFTVDTIAFPAGVKDVGEMTFSQFCSATATLR